jgi:hypothetical protein
MAVGDNAGSINSPEEMDRKITGPMEIQNKKAMTDMMWEKVRQYIKTLPLHKQIELHGKILKNDFNLSLDGRNAKNN